MIQLKQLEKSLESAVLECDLSECDKLLDDFLQQQISTASASSKVHEMLLKIWRSDVVRKEYEYDANCAVTISPADRDPSEYSVPINSEITEKRISSKSHKATFLQILNRLAGCIINTDQLHLWYQELSIYAIDSSGHRMDVAELARDFLSGVLTGSIQYSDEVDPQLLETNAHDFGKTVLDLYVSSKLPEGSPGEPTDERIRYVQQNCRQLFGIFARVHTKAAFTMLNEYFVYAKYRLSILNFVVEYFADSQNSKLFRVYETPFFESLLKCLERDYARPCMQLALTSLSMLIAHICNKLADVLLLCRLYAIYGRACSWQPVTLSLQPELHEKCMDWELVNDDDVQPDEVIDVIPLFTFLYSLFPINTLQFSRQCDEYLLKHNYTRTFSDFWSRFMVTGRTEDVVKNFKIDSQLLTSNEDTELTKAAQRFQQLGSALDIASSANSKYVSQASSPNDKDITEKIDEHRKVFETPVESTASHWHRELLLLRNELAFANFTRSMSETRALRWQKRASQHMVDASRNEELTRINKLLQKKVVTLEEETLRATRSARTIMRERSAYESKLLHKTKETRESISATESQVLQLEKEKEILEMAERKARAKAMEEQNKLSEVETELRALKTEINTSSEQLPESNEIKENGEVRELQERLERQEYQLRSMSKEHETTIKRLKQEMRQVQQTAAKAIQIHNAYKEPSTKSSHDSSAQSITVLSQSVSHTLLHDVSISNTDIGYRDMKLLLSRFKTSNDTLSAKCSQLERELRARKIYEEERLNELQAALTSTKFFGPTEPVMENKFRGRGGAQGVPRR